MTEYVSPRDEYDEFLAMKEASEYAESFGDDRAPLICQHIQTYLLYKFKQKRRPLDLKKEAEQRAAYMLWLSERIDSSAIHCKYASVIQRGD